MARIGFTEERVGTPEGVKLQLQGDEVTVSGKLGSLQRRFPHPRVSLSLTGADLVIRSELPGRREKAVVGTFAAHVRNMIQGVTAGFTYRMKIVYAHFPMKASVKGAEFVIENFLGERSPRRTRIVGETKVVVQGDQVVLTGSNVEDVGQTAANIERATKIRGFDPRVFQDGIYITSKGEEA
ncbi:MAG: 50S ribosomal protein L6 [Methanobacteriota archaeon]|nr:MAG: 50S ribosomal protein L6 [Euryarchaeota archaeon]